MGQAAAGFADPLFEAIAVTYTIGSSAAVVGRLPASIVRLDSTKLVAEAIMMAHAGR